ncbi:MAG: hypothetical protein AB1540_14895 [Bdellovibrionota bacterium]
MKRQIPVLLFLVAFSACSFEDPQSSKNGGGLKIILEEQASSQELSMNLSQLNWFPNSSSFRTQATPTSIADFNCFAVNITGPGVPQSNNLDGCISPDNMRGRGFGLTSDGVPRGQSIEVDITTGPSRAIDVYGIYPSNHCGGSGGSSGGGGSGDEEEEGAGYFLGGVMRNIVEATSITVPISYGGGGPSVQCPNDSKSLAMDGAQGRAFRYSSASCTQDASVSVTSVAPTPGGGANEAASYSAYAAEDGAVATLQCTFGGSDTEVAEFYWDLAGIDLNTYRNFTVIWVGASGRFTSACDGTTTLSDAGGGGGNMLQIYNATAGQWWTIQNTTQTVTKYVYQGGQTQGFAQGGRLYMRVVAGEVTSTQCSRVVTDYAKLILKK